MVFFNPTCAFVRTYIRYSNNTHNLIFCFAPSTFVPYSSIFCWCEIIDNTEHIADFFGCFTEHFRGNFG